MINLVESPYGREINNVSKEAFVEKLSDYTNKETIEFIISNERVEITYSKYEEVIRFDFVNVEPLFNKKPIAESRDKEEYDYEFINMDLYLKKGIIKFYIELDCIDSVIKFIPENNKTEFIEKFKSLKSVLIKEGFYLEVCSNSTMCLVSENLKGLTIAKVKNALNMIEDFKKVVFDFSAI